MLRKIKNLYVITSCMLLLCSPVLHAEDAGKEKVVAVGKGFTVTADDVKDLYPYFKDKGFTSTEKEYLQVAVKMRLFSLEALANGLADKPADTVEQMDKDGQKYLRMVAANYSMDDLVMESYYRSYPERFRNPDFKEGEDVPELIPLTDDLKRMIKQKILKSKTPLIIQNAYESLKKKYEVRFCSEGGCQ